MRTSILPLSTCLPTLRVYPFASAHRGRFRARARKPGRGSAPTSKTIRPSIGSILATPRSPKRSKKLPAYQRICDSIRRRIEAGELTTGAPIESERSLARIYTIWKTIQDTYGTKKRPAS